MGYWHASPEGHSFADSSPLVWGDSPADVMDNAVEKIIAAFQRDLGREPSKPEMISGLLFSLNTYDLDEES